MVTGIKDGRIHNTRHLCVDTSSRARPRRREKAPISNAAAPRAPAPRRRLPPRRAGPRARRAIGAPPGAPIVVAAHAPTACRCCFSLEASLWHVQINALPGQRCSTMQLCNCYTPFNMAPFESLVKSMEPPRGLELCDTVEETSLRLLAEFRVRAQKTRAVLRDLELSGPITRPHRCPFASKTHCGSHATHARLPAPPTAALRSAGAAPHWFLACGPARTSGGAAPRAGTPRAAHHEPGARAPEGVRMQRLIAVAASAVGRETRRRAVNNVASMACGGGRRRRMASRRRRGAHTRA